MTTGDASNRNAGGKWILRPRPNPSASLRVFCFPYAGIGASVYRTWATEFPAFVELCLMQPPGREARWNEAPFKDAVSLAASAADAIAQQGPTPFVFYGHSLGALVSFEVARQLRRQNLQSPLHLFVSAHRAPQLPNPHPQLRNLPDGEFIEQVSRQYDGIPQIVLENPDLLQLMLPCLRADFTAFETYAYRDEEPLRCPISAFGGRQDRRVSEAELEPWRQQTRDAFQVQTFEGGHFFLQGRRDELISKIRRELDALGAVVR